MSHAQLPISKAPVARWLNVERWTLKVFPSVFFAPFRGQDFALAYNPAALNAGASAAYDFFAAVTGS